MARSGKRKESKQALQARIAKAVSTRKARTLAAKQAVAILRETYPPAAIREKLLKDGIALTMGERNKSYGDPFINFMLTARMKQLFWDAMETSGKQVQQNSPYGHAIDMALMKFARVATAQDTHLLRDAYLDIANYAAIAYEVGVRSDKPL